MKRKTRRKIKPFLRAAAAVRRSQDANEKKQKARNAETLAAHLIALDYDFQVKVNKVTEEAVATIVRGVDLDLSREMGYGEYRVAVTVSETILWNATEREKYTIIQNIAARLGRELCAFKPKKPRERE